MKKKMPASEFKAHALKVLAQVNKTGQAVQVTRYGKVIAEIVPPEPTARKRNWLGSMRGSVTIHGDIVGPILAADEWGKLG
jgi:antitoxin (DNA-binding transcriptional repressor) of toxin-antitoxin stability system